VSTSDIVYVLPDKLGGVVSFCENLLAHRDRGRSAHGVVLTHNRSGVDVRSAERLPADWQRTVEYDLPGENVYAVARRVRDAMRGRGALVANDWIELATAAAFPLDRTVFSIVHGDFDYYYQLAVRHEPDVDAFITYSKTIQARLIELMPHREKTIFLRRYGVRIGRFRRATSGPLRLLYSGRLDRRKGVFDLPDIDVCLRQAGVEVTWTVQGAGLDADELRQSWPGDHVRWTGRQDMPQVLAEYERHDVLVMPSRCEGLPVALLEAGAAGVVPVVSDLQSGIPEVVRTGETGFCAPVGNIRSFAAAISALARNRVRLEQMSTAVRRIVASEWDIRQRAPEYQAMFERWPELRRPRKPARTLPYGSRLDRRWLPNPVVRAVRSMMSGRTHAW
jgi:glycosyltransferase involved in cell wall biosynthesis